MNFADGSPAPMARLAGVAIGAFVYLTDSGGTEHRYRVVGLQTFPKSGLSPGIFSSEGPAQLVLITCDQNGPRATIDGIVQYANNTVATAVLWP